MTIKNIQILNSLKVSEDEEHLRHVFGTHFEDLQQIYTGRVLINGSLTLVNIEVDSDKLFLKGRLEAIDIDFYKDFWMKSLDQVSIIKFYNHFLVFDVLNLILKNFEAVFALFLKIFL